MYLHIKLCAVHHIWLTRKTIIQQSFVSSWADLLHRIFTKEEELQPQDYLLLLKGASTLVVWIRLNSKFTVSQVERPQKTKK
jgi:hypothetical protein